MDNTAASLLPQILSGVLKDRTVDWSKGFIDNGGDSLALVFFIAAITKSCGIELTAQQVLGAASLDELRDQLSTCDGVDARTQADGTLLGAPPQGPVCGTVPLAANRFSYFDRRGRDFEYWILSPALIRCDLDFERTALSKAVEYLVAHHDGLRLQLERVADGWKQWIAGPSELEHFIDVRYAGPGDSPKLTAFVEDTIERMYEEFTFPGALFKVLVVTPDTGRSVVCVIAHHIAMDAFAIGVMLRDLNTLYVQARAGKPLELLAKTTSYIDYIRSSKEYWCSRRDALEFWRGLPWSEVRQVPIADDFTPEKNAERHTTCSIARTRVLTRADLVGERADVKPDLLPMLLAAIARAYGEWTSHDVLLLSTLFHGRENFLPRIDLSRTVGYLCDFAPILLNTRLSLEDGWRAATKQVSHARVAGKSYGVYRYLSSDVRVHEEFSRHPQSQISLNVIPPQMRHAGHCEFGTIADDIRRPPGTKGTTHRAFLLSGGVYYADEHFCIAWDYSSLLLDKESVDRFTAACMRDFLSLRDLARVTCTARP